jgi:hypothetical protein
LPRPARRPFAAEACTLRFTVLNQTSSGEHKFKLLGLVVSEVAGMMLNDSGVSSGIF